MNKLKVMINPTPKEQIDLYEKLIKMHDDFAKQRGCLTCLHCKHVIDYPGITLAEESVCLVGLKCDTILNNVRDCPKYETGSQAKELREKIRKLESEVEDGDGNRDRDKSPQ